MSETQPPKLNAAAIEVALARHFETNRNFCIPNVKWGFRSLSYEIDLMVVTTSMYAYEVEIKISAGDLRRDSKKWKWNYCGSEHNFRKSYFAMPEDMLKYQDLVPAHAGILTVRYNRRATWFEVVEARAPTLDGLAKKLTETEFAQLGRLCMLRMWDLKQADWGRNAKAQQQRLETEMA